jgi:hypothetical protein
MAKGLLSRSPSVVPIHTTHLIKAGNVVPFPKAERMVQYRFAKRADGSIVDALELAGTELEESIFRCLGCDRQLIAKVHGSKRRPHFAHRPGAECHPEPYLHRLGKQVFSDVFNHCLASGEPFEIELRHPVVCRRFEACFGSACVQKRVHTKTYDLTSYYSRVVTEQRDGQFVPDLLLTSESNPKSKVYVEIAVTHFLSEEKEHSGERIIEIPLESEDNLEAIRSRRLTEDNARFRNFTTDSQSLVDTECQCATRPCYAFFVYDSGKCVLDKSTLAALVSKRHRLGDKIQYFRIVDCRDERLFDYLPSAGKLFREAVEQSRQDGFPLKNCYLCRYHGNSFAGNSEKPIYCKCFKTTCNSNEAVTCEAFRPP